MTLASHHLALKQKPGAIVEDCLGIRTRLACFHLFSLHLSSAPLPLCSSQTTALTAEKEREAKVSNSKQFIQLKGMLQRKNAQLAEMRAKVAK